MARITGGAGSFGAAPRTKSASASIRHQFTDWLDGFLDLSHNQTHSRQPEGRGVFITLAADDPHNPFQQPIQLIQPTHQFHTYSQQSNSTERPRAGPTAPLGADWWASLDF